ncbi:uncharacterized protein LOC106006785 [Mustela putorius furo]|uniref:Uncharacterized protein LOC106006785 n=1 Tax=Mustela putorius furo TaxID=9669 RepID=A0A8U0V589_MUSPF|nr:uncharacterized protein LOC106006785 [Mustela putorius furo]
MSPLPLARVVSRRQLRLAWTPQTASPMGCSERLQRPASSGEMCGSGCHVPGLVSDFPRDPDLDGASMLLCRVLRQLPRWPPEGWVSTGPGHPSGLQLCCNVGDAGSDGRPAKAQWFSTARGCILLAHLAPLSSRTPARAPGFCPRFLAGAGRRVRFTPPHPWDPRPQPSRGMRSVPGPWGSLWQSGLPLLLWFPREASDGRQWSVWAPASSLTRPPSWDPLLLALQQQRIWEETGVSTRAHLGPLLVPLYNEPWRCPCKTGSSKGLFLTASGGLLWTRWQVQAAGGRIAEGKVQKVSRLCS